jgi:hypothetical protein
MSLRKILFSRHRVSFQSTIRHTPVSLAEGSPARLRVIMDQYTGFVINADSVQTNYTGRNVR